jgi:hypothetical protein
MKSIIKYALYTIFLFTSLVILSCSKDDSNPVESTIVVSIKGNLTRCYEAGYSDDILKADLLFDGNVIASASFQTATYHASFDCTINSVKKGTHTISFRITNQKTSPNCYAASISKLTAGNSTYELEDKLATLATGESITYSVTL